MKSSSTYICQQCGYQSASFLGKCPECGSWNSLVETPHQNKLGAGQASLDLGQLVKLADVKKEHLARASTGFGEFDRVLGGGIVPGSIVLIAGDPGIGKSTLLLQCAMKIARGPVTTFPPTSARSKLKSKGNQQDNVELRAVGSPSSRATPRKSNVNGQLSSIRQAQDDPEFTEGSNVVLYVTGEESPQQVKIRADRLVHSSQFTLHQNKFGTGQAVDGLSKAKKKSVNREPITENLYILPITDVEAIIAACEKLNPALLIVDSIQTITTEALSGSAGSVGQVRECAQILQRHAKSSKVPIFVVGHVTKEGNIAGPKVLEHLVDAVLNLEGDGTHAFRILRSTKNRFGSTFEVGVFEMQDAGLLEVANPSSIFLSQRLEMRAGSVVCASIAGVRPVLAEIQALTTSTIFGMPTRRVTGLDFGRIQIVLAALVRAANLPLGSLDVYVNVAGGLKIAEPAADLAAALAVVSAAVDKPVKSGMCAYGEVGLLGELRPVGNVKGRMNEAKRLGFSDFVTAERFKTLEEAIGYAIHGE